jgi:hypothetical protein
MDQGTSGTWLCLDAPILTRLHDATVAALVVPEVRDHPREQGAEVVGSSPAELNPRHHRSS